jgi:ABC-2 type transport system ATP-binding protein
MEASAPHARADKTTEHGAAILPFVAGARARNSETVVPSARPALVSLSGIWRYWGRGKSRHPVLCDINLDLMPGSATYVSGRNGVGKTTLLRVATGILAPQSGTVSVDGIASTDSWREYHRRIGFVSAGDRGLYARVTVEGHLDYWTAIAMIPRRERRELVDQALARFDLVDLRTRRADRLSQGQRQRLRLALALVHQPKVLFLDEPRNSLDDEGQEILVESIADVRNRDGAVLCCGPAGEDRFAEFGHTAELRDGTLSFT